MEETRLVVEVGKVSTVTSRDEGTREEGAHKSVNLRDHLLTAHPSPLLGPIKWDTEKGRRK